MEQGFQVDVIDGSYNLCQKASEYTGITVQCMMFQELNELEVYDGIWACTSILHLAKKELKLVMGKIIQVLKVNGVIYTSFKYGDFEGEGIKKIAVIWQLIMNEGITKDTVLFWDEPESNIIQRGSKEGDGMMYCTIVLGEDLFTELHWCLEGLF